MNCKSAKIIIDLADIWGIIKLRFGGEASLTTGAIGPLWRNEPPSLASDFTILFCISKTER
jgi:hypothetical protein